MGKTNTHFLNNITAIRSVSHSSDKIHQTKRVQDDELTSNNVDLESKLWSHNN